MLRQLERDLFLWIGEQPISEIHAMELLAALHKVEERALWKRQIVPWCWRQMCSNAISQKD